ncbi:MAG: hypothetical protein HY661_03025 [Betaproteobacteria bacterium]|nr:hypothetical protein [Betaproteobacteria bacterium]
MAKPEIVLCNPVRTAIGTYGGALKDTPAPALGAAVIREVLKRSGLAPQCVETVAMGNLMHSMKRDDLKRGVVTLCIGGGQGIALALETV